MFKCNYCELECKNLVGLNRHNRLAHNITTEEFKIIYKDLYPKKEITENSVQCKICGEYSLPLGMASHLKRKHNISGKDYYDTYCKKEQDGICKICNKPASFRGITYGYSDYCSSKCVNLDQDIQTKIKNTNLEKYGVEHPLQSDQVKDKIKQTCIDKYGVDSYMKTKEFREKSIEVVKSEKVQNKRKQTNQERYGVDMPFQSKDIQDKVKESNLEKYGVENIFASDYGKQKIKETCLQKYGCENGGASKQAQDKIKDTKLKKSEEFCKQNNCIPLIDLDVDYSVKDSIFHNKLLLYNDRYYVRKEDIDEIIKHTPQNRNQSVLENNIIYYIESIYNGTIIRNTKDIIKPKELDIYLPDLKLAIEVDGIWHHSTNNYTPKDYHLSKTKACENLGIRLIHITEWEWVNRQDICKSIIASALGIYQTKIYARLCDIRDISQNELDNFLNINHIQGKIKATYKIGLFYKDELVQIICIGKSRYKKDEMELLRMCTKLHTQVIGGFSKLMKYQPYNNLISYVDLSKFNGNSYINTNWSIIGSSSPSYAYYKQNIKLNRLDTQKHKLKDLLGDLYNPNETEIQNMIRCNWLQVYDCGTIKLQYNKN